MAKGISLHIGLNSVDAKHYQGWDGQLRACEADAQDMKTLADGLGYASKLLLTKDATSRRVLRELAKAAKTLQTGDTFFLTYSGHGGQVPDVNNEEEDGLDETWVLYDRMLVDDELYGAWARFAPGVRIVMLSDSCHSGSVTREPPFLHLSTMKPLMDAYPGSEQPVYRAIPPEVEQKTYQVHQDLYDAVQFSHPKGDSSDFGASVILISGCQDNQTSADGLKNGLFTGTLLKVWNGGKFQGTYSELRKAVVRKMPPTQSPNYFVVGASIPSFVTGQAFALSAA